MKTIDVKVGTDDSPQTVTCIAMPSIATPSIATPSIDLDEISSCDFCAASDGDNLVGCVDLPSCKDIVWVNKDKLHEYVACRLTGEKK